MANAGEIKLNVNIDIGKANTDLKKFISVIDKLEKSGTADLKSVSKAFDNLETEIKQTTVAQDKLASSSVGTGSKMKNLGANIGGYAMAINAVISGIRGLINATSEYINLSNIQEQAENNLAGALRARGLDDSIDEYKRYASEIQRTTTLGDEQVLSIQKTVASMGVERDSINDTTGMIIGITKAYEGVGLSQEAATKGIMLARQGDFNALKRYIPELRTATSATEALAIIQEKSAQGMAIANAETESGAGQMQQFSNLIGDVKEDLGDFIKVFAGVFIGQMKPILIEIIDFFEENKDTIVLVLNVIANAVGMFAKLFFGYIKNIITNWQLTVDMLADGSLIAINSVQILKKMFIEAFNDMLSVAKNFAKAYFFVQTGQFGKAKEAFEDMKDSALNSVSAISKGTGEITRQSVEFGKKYSKGFTDSFKENFIDNIKSSFAEAQKEADKKPINVPVTVGGEGGAGQPKVKDRLKTKDSLMSAIGLAGEMEIPVRPTINADDDSFTQMFKTFEEFGQEVGATLDSTIAMAFDGLIEGGQNLSDIMQNLMKDLAKMALMASFRILLGFATGGAGTSFASLLGMAGGGSISGFAGGLTVPNGYPNDSFRIGNIALSSGEEVIPKSKAGGSNMVNLNITGGNFASDENAMVRYFTESIQKAQRNSNLITKG